VTTRSFTISLILLLIIIVVRTLSNRHNK